MINPLKSIATKAVDTLLKSADNNRIFAEYYKRSDASKKVDWTKQATIYKAKTIDDWATAIMAATNPDDPRRGLLMRFYESLKLDLHLMSCIENRILPIQCAPFRLVDKAGKEDLEAHKLLEKPWFMDLIKLILNHIYEGTKLIELISLNDKGELAEVKEIPQSNFLPGKGMIVTEEYDTNGVSYKEGVYSNYYVQIGNDYSLGLLCTVSMVVLAKKLGLGSWMSYIEKFGVPPVFAITERMDAKRLEELYDMLSAFRSNHFAILQGSERIEIPNNQNADGYQSFKELNAFCNSEISKFFLGGTGTTDEKAFVGSAEVHERLLKYRHQVDKLILKYYLNEEILPRLVKLSSVYAPLANLSFEFDDTESLTLKEKIAAVKDLGNLFNFDAEKIAEITGLPITSVKEVLNQTTPPTDPTKKKANAKIGASLYYSPRIHAKYASVFAATWDAAIERLATQIYNGEVKPADLDRDLVLKNYAAFNKEASAAWGKDYYSEELTRKMRDNLMKFSGAKAYNLMTDLHNIDAKAGMSKESFIKLAKKIVETHNSTWLDTEKRYVASSAASAKDWQGYIKDADIYPNLKYRTMEDEDVRDSHQALDGIIKPINDAFWTTHFPPNDWGCRCYTEQTTANPTIGIPNVPIKEQFQTNPGMDGVVFKDDNNYQQSIAKKDKGTVHNNMQLMKQYAPYNNTIITKKGNKIYVNDFADASDLSQNRIAAEKIADLLDNNIYIRPHAQTTIGTKNAEFGIGTPNILGDLKTYEPEVKGKPVELEKFITNRLLSCNNQKCTYAVLDLSNYKGDDLKESLIRRLCGNITPTMNKSIDNVIIIHGNNVYKISRKNIIKRDFKSFLNQ
jgi:SPP1 gp7 family putative phage head morphogenesis protein